MSADELKTMSVFSMFRFYCQRVALKENDGIIIIYISPDESTSLLQELQSDFCTTNPQTFEHLGNIDIYVGAVPKESELYSAIKSITSVHK